MYAVETVRCVDCYAVAYTDEMRQCPQGHWTCASCLCDCEAEARLRTGVPSWLQSEVRQMQEFGEL